MKSNNPFAIHGINHLSHSSLNTWLQDPARFIARKENEDMQMRRKEELMDEKRAVTIVNNQNTVNKGGDNYSEVRGGEIHVHDQGKDPYTNMA